VCTNSFYFFHLVHVIPSPPVSFFFRLWGFFFVVFPPAQQRRPTWFFNLLACWSSRHFLFVFFLFLAPSIFVRWVLLFELLVRFYFLFNVFVLLTGHFFFPLSFRPPRPLNSLYEHSYCPLSKTATTPPSNTLCVFLLLASCPLLVYLSPSPILARRVPFSG